MHDYCFISERYSLTPPEYEEDEIAAFDPTSEKKYENYYQVEFEMWNYICAVRILLCMQAIFLTVTW